MSKLLLISITLDQRGKALQAAMYIYFDQWFGLAALCTGFRDRKPVDFYEADRKGYGQVTSASEVPLPVAAGFSCVLLWLMTVM